MAQKSKRIGKKIPAEYPDKIRVCVITRDLGVGSQKIRYPRYCRYDLFEVQRNQALYFATALSKLNDIDLDETTLLNAKVMREAIQRAIEYLNRKEEK